MPAAVNERQARCWATTSGLSQWIVILNIYYFQFQWNDGYDDDGDV